MYTVCDGVGHLRDKATTCMSCGALGRLITHHQAPPTARSDSHISFRQLQQHVVNEAGSTL